MSVIMTIAKEFSWEMSHRLPAHKGHCKNIHGHSYKLRLEVDGTLDENGMVLDYYCLNSVMESLIDDLDHCFIVDKNDSIMLKFLQENGFKHYILENSTTAENIAIHICQTLRPILIKYKNLLSFKIRLYETATVFAEVSTSLID